MIQRITESQLREIVRSTVHEELQNEGWLKNLAVGGAITAAAMNPTNANAQQTYNYRTPDDIRYQYSTNKRDSVFADKDYNKKDSITNHPCTEQELIQRYPLAYQDRNATPDVWKKNAKKYSTEIGEKSQNRELWLQIAAKDGKNPWQAILDKYTSRNYKNKMKQQAEREKAEKDIFTLGDFDIK